MRRLRIWLLMGVVSASPLATQLLTVDASPSKARALLDRGEAAGAVAVIEALPPGERSHPNVQALLGRALAQDRRFEDAERVLAAAVAAGQEDFVTKMAWAAACWENGRLDEAETIYREVVERSSGDPVALYPLAGLLLFEGRAEEAVPFYARVRELRPSWTHVGLDHARALEQSGQPQQALIELSRFLSSSPEHSEALYTLAAVLRQLGRDDEAADVLERFRELEARDSRATLESGRRRVALEEVKRLLAQGGSAAALPLLAGLGEDVETMRLTARALEAEGRPTEALRMFERAVAADPGRADTRVELQEAYRRLGESR